MLEGYNDLSSQSSNIIMLERIFITDLAYTVNTYACDQIIHENTTDMIN